MNNPLQENRELKSSMVRCIEKGKEDQKLFEARLIEEQEKQVMAKSQLRAVLKDICHQVGILADILHDLPVIEEGNTSNEGNSAPHFRRLFEERYREFVDTLTKHGVTVEEPLKGVVADITKFDVAGVQERSHLPDFTVIDVLTPAFEWNTEILKKGSVIVAKQETNQPTQIQETPEPLAQYRENETEE